MIKVKKLFLISALFFSLLASGQNLEKNEKACKAGDAVACFNLGAAYIYDKNIKQDFVKAKQLFEKSCDSNFYGGCIGLASMYYLGRGVKEDEQIAKKFFQKACDLGGDERSCWMVETIILNEKKEK